VCGIFREVFLTFRAKGKAFKKSRRVKKGMEIPPEELVEYHHKEKQISVKAGSLVFVCDTPDNPSLQKLLFVVSLQMPKEKKMKYATEENEKDVSLWGKLNLRLL
jgi:hypothetical protein